MSTGVEYESTPATDTLTRPRPTPINLDLWEPEQFGAAAHKAFMLGLADGENRASPRDGHAIMIEVFQAGTYGRVFHRQKIRQVYGAGFDIMQCRKRVNALVTTTNGNS